MRPFFVFGMIIFMSFSFGVRQGMSDCNTCKSRPKRVVPETKRPTEQSHHHQPPSSTPAPTAEVPSPANLTNLPNLPNLPQMPNLSDVIPASLNVSLFGNMSAALHPKGNGTYEKIHQPPEGWSNFDEDDYSNEFPNDCSCRVYNSTTHVCENTSEYPTLEIQFPTVEPFKNYYEVDDQTACGRVCEHWMAENWRMDLPICKKIPSQEKVPFVASLFAKAHMSSKWYFIYTTPDVICCENTIQVNCH